MTPASSITFFKPEFQDFLYAPVSTQVDAPTLSVLSALARLGLDPWAEASELAHLPIEAARARLATLLGGLPTGSWPQTDGVRIVDRLVQLLPRHGYARTAAPESPAMHLPQASRASARLLIVVALAVAVLVTLALRAAPSTPDGPGDRPSIDDTRR